VTTETEDQHRPSWHLPGSLRVIGSWTFLSRLLGYVRDALTAALLGGSSWQVDTFLTVFPIPNLFRRVFGEGALASSFLPLFSETRRREGEREAWRFASLVFSLLATVLVTLAAAGEVAFWIALRWGVTTERSTLLLRLLFVLFPYLVPICLAALLGAMLQALGRFGRPAFAPALLNFCWLGALGLLWWRRPGAPQETWVMALAVAVLVSGLLQMAVIYQGVSRRGRLRWRWKPTGPRLRQMLALMLPAAVGAAVFQLNVLADRFIALYGTESGGVFALYLGMRVTQLPLALIGISMGTIALAALSDAAGREDEGEFRRTLVSALSGVVVLAVPASVGLALLAGPTVRLLFQWRAFGQQAGGRAAAVLVMYVIGLWAYCLQQVLVRAYYARKDMRTPVRVGLPMVGVNLGLNLALVGPLAERGLALATAVTAALQVTLLAWGLRPWLAGRGWLHLGNVTVRSLVASAGLAAAVLAAGRYLSPAGEAAWERLAAVGIPLAVGVVTYLALSAALGLEEVWDLLRKRRQGQGA